MESDESSYAVLESSRFWVQKVFVPILLGIGLIGNTITVMVLTRRRMRSSTNTYLSALAIADIIHLIFGFLLSFQHYPNIHDRKYELYWRFYGLTHWLCDAASATSAWLAVSFTIERYIAVCHPMKGKVFCTERRAKSIIVIVYILCLLTTASTAFEYQLTFNDECIEKCKLPAKDLTLSGNSQNGSNLTNFISHHVIQPAIDTKNRNINSYDAYLQNQIKNILSNCTSHPHVIYVPIYPEFYNMTRETFIERTLANATSEVTPVTRIEREETVLEKPTIDPLEENATILIEETELLRNDSVLDNTVCCVKNLTIDVESTELGKNISYTNFIYWYSALCFGIIPFVLIATFNCFLVRAVYVSQRLRRVMTNSQENVTFTNEKRITIMLIGIVFIFLICNTPTSSYLIYFHFHRPETAREKNVMLILGNFFNLLMMLNAPCNFLIYCLLSKKFRGTFKKIFWERRKAKTLDTEAILLSATRNSKKFNPYKHGLMRKNASEYRTPRHLEAQSLTSIPRSKSLMARPLGKTKSTDLVI